MKILCTCHIPTVGYYVRPRMDTSETIPFKTPGSCSNATKMDVMWCLRLASLAHNAMACIDSSGEITATPSAIQLGLQENIMLDDTGSLVVKKFQDIYMYSLISLISATKDCEGVSHHVVFMKCECLDEYSTWLVHYLDQLLYIYIYIYTILHVYCSTVIGWSILSCP